MIQYINCSHAPEEQIFQAFIEGFSDYIVKFKMDRKFFFKHFFGPEGNELKLSWLAMDGDKPVGLVLGGIRRFDGKKTMRCGTMCVIPDYRKKGIASELLKKHRETARNEGCDQMFLECIDGNDKALNFYDKEGYERQYYLHYFSKETPEELIISHGEAAIEQIDLDELKALRKESGVHINWQNEMEYLEQNDPELYGIRQGGEVVAAIAVKDTRIQFIYVRESFRKSGYGRQLVSHAANGREKLTVSFPDNEDLAGFYNKLGFNREPIGQHEMYRSVD